MAGGRQTKQTCTCTAVWRKQTRRGRGFSEEKAVPSTGRPGKTSASEQQWPVLQSRERSQRAVSSVPGQGAAGAKALRCVGVNIQEISVAGAEREAEW